MYQQLNKLGKCAHWSEASGNSTGVFWETAIHTTINVVSRKKKTGISRRQTRSRTTGRVNWASLVRRFSMQCAYHQPNVKFWVMAKSRNRFSIEFRVTSRIMSDDHKDRVVVVAFGAETPFTDTDLHGAVGRKNSSRTSRSSWPLATILCLTRAMLSETELKLFVALSMDCLQFASVWPHKLHLKPTNLTYSNLTPYLLLGRRRIRGLIHYVGSSVHS